MEIHPQAREHPGRVMFLKVIVSEMKSLRRQIRHFLGVIHEGRRFQMERSVRVVAWNRYVCAEPVVRDLNLSHSHQ